MLNCLLKVLKSPNFKVRISASQALTSLTSRALYGNLYVVIWQSLVSALKSISTDVNFKEVKHQENLGDQVSCTLYNIQNIQFYNISHTFFMVGFQFHFQLCYSLCQLTVLISSEDIPLIAQSVLESREILLTSMWKFGSHLTEEKSMLVICILFLNNVSLFCLF